MANGRVLVAAVAAVVVAVALPRAQNTPSRRVALELVRTQRRKDCVTAITQRN